MKPKFTFIPFFLLYIVMYNNPLMAQEKITGSQIYEKIRTLDFKEREVIISKELLEGNHPAFLLDWQEIISIQKDAKGKPRKLSLFVSPDYLSVGNKEDYFIIPLSPITAQNIANHYNASLPTPKVSDLIYREAKLKLEPFNYIPRGKRNETVDIFYDHSRTIQAQIKSAGYAPGIFVAGTKKDVVISSNFNDSTSSQHVSIYGWHKLNGKAIQPLYDGHINTYVDYSHGVRLISNRVFIDGKEFDYREILKDQNLYKLLSNESQAFKKTTY